MAVIVDFPLDRFEDGTLYVNLVPPVAVGGQSLTFQVAKRFGSSAPFVTRSMSSGFYGTSGMNIVVSGNGQISVQLQAGDFSGQNYGNYAYEISRVDSGFQTDLTQGYCILRPSMG